MATPIIMPKFGQMTEESAIVEWLKKEGDKVAKGDMLFTVETDKSVMEVESFEDGTLLKIVVHAGDQRPRAEHRRFPRRDRAKPFPERRFRNAARLRARRLFRRQPRRLAAAERWPRP